MSCYFSLILRLFHLVFLSFSFYIIFIIDIEVKLSSNAVDLTIEASTLISLVICRDILAACFAACLNLSFWDPFCFISFHLQIFMSIILSKDFLEINFGVFHTRLSLFYFRVLLLLQHFDFLLSILQLFFQILNCLFFFLKLFILYSNCWSLIRANHCICASNIVNLVNFLHHWNASMDGFVSKTIIFSSQFIIHFLLVLNLDDFIFQNLMVVISFRFQLCKLCFLFLEISESLISLNMSDVDLEVLIPEPSF